MTEAVIAPPHDIQAEMAVLGSMMSSDAVLAECLRMLKPAAFWRPAHQLIFEACSSLAESGKPADWLTVKAEMERLGTITQAGGPLKLHDCLMAVPAAANGPHYAAQLLEYQSQRELAAVATRIAQVAGDDGLNRLERAEAARSALEDVLAAPAATGLRDISEVMVDVIGALERGEVRGVRCGMRDLDDLTGGFAAGELVLVAARPGIGKSVLVAGFARHAVMTLGIPVLLASLEMSADEIALRLISADAKVPLFPLVQRNVSSAHWKPVMDAAMRISGSPLVIDDTPSMTLAGIRSRLREMARTAPAQMLIVDYLGLLETPRAENRQAAVAALSRGLKLIAREFGIPVVAAAQLNRKPEERSDKRPQMSDLRESGAQEQDADIVILLHREDAYDRESRPGRST